MNYGLTPTGFRAKRINTILEELAAKERSKFGNVQTDAASVLGQLNGVFGEVAAEIWEQAQNIYLSLSPKSAEGASLDMVVDFNGVIRLDALPSLVTVGLNGATSTIVLEGTTFKSSIGEYFFRTLADVTILPTGFKKLYIKLPSVAANTAYWLQLSTGITTISYMVNSGPSPDLESVTSLMVAAINNDSSPNATAVATNTGNGEFILVAREPYTQLRFVLPNSQFDYYIPVECESTIKGNIPVSAKTITIIDSPVSGLTDVINLEDGARGRSSEEDSELRIRRKTSIKVVGAGNLEAIVARMAKEVPLVTACKGFENNTDDIVDGRPRHSIEIVVQGGAPSNIAAQLWKTKGGGIQTFGNTSETTLDSNGDIQRVYYTIPTLVYITIMAYIVKYNEEYFPADGLAQIRSAILVYGNSLGIGTDVLPQRFVSYIHGVVPGIESIDFLAGSASTPEATPELTHAIIRIAGTNIAAFSASRIFSQLSA